MCSRHARFIICSKIHRYRDSFFCYKSSHIELLFRSVQPKYGWFYIKYGHCTLASTHATLTFISIFYLALIDRHSVDNSHNISQVTCKQEDYFNHIMHGPCRILNIVKDTPGKNRQIGYLVQCTLKDWPYLEVVPQLILSIGSFHLQNLKFHKSIEVAKNDLVV